MSTVSIVEVLYIVLCGLGASAGCVGAYMAQVRLGAALRALERHPHDLEAQGRVHTASDLVRSSLARTTVMFCFLIVGIASAMLPAQPSSANHVPLFIWLVPIALIVGPAVLAIDFYLEWMSRVALEELVRAIKEGPSAPQ